MESFKKEVVQKTEDETDNGRVELTAEDEALIQRVLETAPVVPGVTETQIASQVDDLKHPVRRDEDAIAAAQKGIKPHDFKMVESGQAVPKTNEVERFDTAA